MTRSLFVLVVALALSGCMRGCSCGSGPAQNCDDSSDCSNGTCRAGSCVSKAWAFTDDECHAASGCSERGECGAVHKASFLGLDPDFECAAVTDEDCRRSLRCATHGACARTPWLHCGGASAQQCRASQRCATHQECALLDLECVRDWTACPALLPPSAPSWAEPVELAWEYESLRAPWQPGELASATLACRIDREHDRSATLRIADHCVRGPTLDGRGHGQNLSPDVPLHMGDAIAIAIQDGPIGHASRDSFAQLRYEGASPMRGGRDGEEIECVVVPHELGVVRSAREIAAIDRELANADHDRPDLARPQAVGSAIEAARTHAGRAALWLSWRAPELALRVPRIDAAEATWQMRLDAAIRALPATPAPIKTERLVISPVGRVCGAALRARNPLAATTGRDTCALELAIENTSTVGVALSPQGSYLDEIAELLWLRPAHDGEPAEVVPATVVEIRVGPTASTATQVELPAGQHALVLVSGFEDGAVLHGRIAYVQAFALRP